MSDYTPTTEQVRERYILPAHRINHEERGEEFDRWLAEEIRDAKAESLREFARSLDLESIAEEWAGPDGAGHWSAGNAVSSVQMMAYVHADREGRSQ